MDLIKKDLKKILPNIAVELQGETGKISITSVRTEVSKTKTSRSSYNPDVIDFLRRCDTKAEGREIIDFLEKRGEISQQYAFKLRSQLKREGIRSFGEKKEMDYYSKKYV
jgi:hypothetical protein